MENKKLEVEYKMLVTKEELNKLIQTYTPIKTINQINHYFDSEPSLYLKGFALRIREINNKFIFALKENAPKGLIEYEFEIDSLNINNSKIKKLLNNLGINDSLNHIGTLNTIRHIYKDEHGEMCLDINKYNNIIDYEVEYELFNPEENHLNHFINLLKVCNITYVKNPLTKLQRLKNAR